MPALIQGLMEPAISVTTTVPQHAANTTSDSGRIHGARSFDMKNPSAPAPATVAAVPAKACVSAEVWTVAKYAMTGPSPSPITRAVAKSQHIAHEATRKHSR